jgi:ATP-dependent RNA helicase DDX51/DBP6
MGGDDLQRQGQRQGQGQQQQEGTQLLPKWMSAPVGMAADITGSTCVPTSDVDWLCGPLRARLMREGVASLFPVQAHVGPTLVRGFTLPHHPGDVCVSAPTGSGKTLAYVLPIVQCLRTRVVRCLRALVVLPTRELVQQVKQVFHTYCQGTYALECAELRVGAITGQSSFAKEQGQLVKAASELEGPESRVDILIATPGRLVDHIKGTPNFMLEHVRFLVIDEADRLLLQAYQDWLPLVQDALHRNQAPCVDAQQPQHFAHTLRPRPGKRTAASDAWCGPSVRKLLFSATLTHDPETLAYLRLVRPLLFAAKQRRADDDECIGVHQQQPRLAAGADRRDNATELMGTFSIPASLQERRVMC